MSAVPEQVRRARLDERVDHRVGRVYQDHGNHESDPRIGLGHRLARRREPHQSHRRYRKGEQDDAAEDVDSEELAGRDIAAEARRAERVVREDECLLARHEPRKGEPQGEAHDERHADVDADRLTGRRRKVEAQAPVRRVARVEHERAHDEPGQPQQEHPPHRVSRGRVELARERVDYEYDECDDPSLQDRLGAGEIIERIAVEAGAAVEVALLADLRPRRVDPQRDEREEEIDDPDAEVLGGRAGELRPEDSLGCRRRTPQSELILPPARLFVRAFEQPRART